MPRRLLFLPRRKASVLIVSLWAFATLSILSLALAGFVFQQIKFSSFYLRQAMSLPMAKAECLRFFEEKKEEKERLKKEPGPEYDSFQGISEQRSQIMCGGAEYKYYFADKKIVDGQEKVIDEGALININLASSEILKRLPGLDDGLVKNIMESSRKPFKLKEELLLVEGITKDIYNKFKDLVTVYGAGKININTVSAEVLSALGLDEELTWAILRYRKDGPDGKEGTGDEGVFTDAGSILSDLRKFYNISLRQEQDLLSIMNLLSVKSEYLRLNVIPVIKGKDGIYYSIVVFPEESKIISWSEY
jgi:DNA uptake protein ComE-like DNA-binding protein